MITQSINLNLIPGGVLPRINVSQYDQGTRTLVFNLFNGATSFTVTGLTVYIVGTKKDNTGFEYACTISGTSQVTCDITDQMTTFEGEVTCEIRILDGTDQLGTCNFILNVEPSALADNTVISETDIPIIQSIPQYVSEAEGYKDLAHQWATYGSDSETPSATNNAKYWANQSQQYATGALQWKGSIVFANIPTTGISQGDMYNVTDSFTTDSRFSEGSGIECPAGTNIIYDENGKWDLQNPPYEASQVEYDNTTSGASATNTQGALDEAFSDIDDLSTEISEVKSNLATIETTSTASQAYSVGDYLVYNGQLYEVTSAIASGGTLTVGTNIVATTVADELSAINSNLTDLVKTTTVSGTTDSVGFIYSSLSTSDVVVVGATVTASSVGRVVHIGTTSDLDYCFQLMTTSNTIASNTNISINVRYIELS